VKYNIIDGDGYSVTEDILNDPKWLLILEIISILWKISKSNIATFFYFLY